MSVKTKHYVDHLSSQIVYIFRRFLFKSRVNQTGGRQDLEIADKGR